MRMPVNHGFAARCAKSSSATRALWQSFGGRGCAASPLDPPLLFRVHGGRSVGQPDTRQRFLLLMGVLKKSRRRACQLLRDYVRHIMVVNLDSVFPLLEAYRLIPAAELSFKRLKMQRPAQIRAIYAELRSCLGPEVPSGDLLRIANLILASYADVLAPRDELGGAREDRTLDTLAVDIAIEDGWKVFYYERKRARNVDDFDPLGWSLLRQKIEKYLGPEWRQHLLLQPSENLYPPVAKAAGIDPEQG